MSETLEKVEAVCRNTFQDDAITLSHETIASDVEGWDSLMHVTFMINLEAAFGIRFTSAEVAAFKNVGDLVQLIKARAA